MYDPQTKCVCGHVRDKHAPMSQICNDRSCSCLRFRSIHYRLYTCVCGCGEHVHESREARGKLPRACLGCGCVKFTPMMSEEEAATILLGPKERSFEKTLREGLAEINARYDREYRGRQVGGTETVRVPLMYDVKDAAVTVPVLPGYAGQRWMLVPEEIQIIHKRDYDLLRNTLREVERLRAVDVDNRRLEKEDEKLRKLFREVQDENIQLRCQMKLIKNDLQKLLDS